MYEIHFFSISYRLLVNHNFQNEPSKLHMQTTFKTFARISFFTDYKFCLDVWLLTFQSNVWLIKLKTSYSDVGESFQNLGVVFGGLQHQPESIMDNRIMIYFSVSKY